MTSKEQKEVSDLEIYKKMSKLFLKLEEKGLPVKNAGYGRIRVEYVRGDDLIKSLNENLDFLCKEINNICQTKIDPQNKQAAQFIYDEFNMRNMLLKAIRFKDDPKMKYPKRLSPYEEQYRCCDEDHGVNSHNHNIPDDITLLDDKKFYVLYLERDKKKTYFWLFIAIGVVLLFCLFPVWPIELKIGIWWVSYILLVFMLSLITIRLIFHSAFYVFGYDFWLFPNLFDDKLGVIDSFKPLSSFSKRNETLLTILIRLSISVVFIYLAWHIYENPNAIYDFINHLTEVNQDVFDWGKDKLINLHNSTAVHIRDKKYLNPLLDEEEENLY